MAAVPELSSVLVFENDIDNELMCVWVYPKIENEFKKLLTEKCELLASEHQDTTFCYGQNNNSWYYIKRSNIKDAGVNDKVKDVYMIITAQNFNPELYQAMGDVFMTSYFINTSNVLTQYLSMYTNGYSMKDDATKLSHTDFNKKKAYLQVCMKELIMLFGVESILMYTGLLLKKRIVVYSPKLDTLLHICRTLPAFVLHRLNWNIVYPFVHFTAAEVSELKTLRSYVVGVTDSSVENQPEYYDLFLNVPDGEIVINPRSKEYFQMGKMHKDIAKYLVQASEDEDTNDEDIIKELKKRTTDIISNLKSLDKADPDDPKITIELLQERNLTTTMQSFLYNLASAEGIVKL
ncbi:DENN domain-containing protein 10-like [Hydractinia symbiolongicarpus]|uniref:DENN domain-containing protein 10-like n=1 Tax=Hydractinia symbiolongicarpus TaxID=13093 RepID=UPI00254A5782|nr:DENN domain-containing protein 10-like [Hydractinia symbiolongicarpus]